MSDIKSRLKNASNVGKDLSGSPNVTPSSDLKRTAPGHLMAALPYFEQNQEKIEALEKELTLEKNKARQLFLPLKALIKVPGRRKYLSPQKWEELLENLRVNALVHAITVRKTSDDAYEIISGHNRVAAYEVLGKTEIFASIIEANDVEAQTGALYANLLQSDISDYEKYIGFKAIIDLSGVTQKQAAINAGADEKSVSRWMSFDSLPSEILNIIAPTPDRIGGSVIPSLIAYTKHLGTDAGVKITQMIIDGEITQDAAVKQMKASNTSLKEDKPLKKPESVFIKSGEKEFCKINSNTKKITVHFQDDKQRVLVEAAIHTLLSEYAESNK